MKKIVILLISAVALVSCKDRITPSGNVISLDRDVDGFSKIAVSHGLSTFITMGEEESLEVTADDNLLPYIETFVSGSTLYIQVQDHVSFRGSPSIRIDVGAVSLTALSGSGGSSLKLEPAAESDNFYIDLSGGSSFKGDIHAVNEINVNISGGGWNYSDISAQKMGVVLSGGSKANFSGSVHDMKLVCSGGGSLGDYSFAADNARLELSGGSVVKMTANTSLKVTGSGGSQVHFKGDAKVVSDGTSVQKID